jgi:sugar phosphate isomerase/epimerase
MKTISETELLELESLYQRANYVVLNPTDRIVIRIGEVSAELDELLLRRGAKSWAFVSAHNPYSRPLSADENNARHEALKDRLNSAGLVFFEGYGESPTGDWEPETSLLILNIDRDAAISLGLELEQNAIVVGEIGGEPELVWCVNLSHSAS